MTHAYERNERFDLVLAFATLAVVVLVALCGFAWQLMWGAVRCAWVFLTGGKP